MPSISQLVGIELRRPASSNISAGLIGESAQGILGIRKRFSPAFLILQLAENPPRDPVLFLGWERRHLLYRYVTGSAHNPNCVRASCKAPAGFSMNGRKLWAIGGRES